VEQSTFDEMERLADAGFALLPLVGKVPFIPFADKQIKFKQVKAIMARNGSNAYGVRLPQLAVVDVDERSPELYDIVTERCGSSTVQTDTSRGRHFYFDNPDNIRIDFRKENLPIDFKTGVNSFVVGPHSIRPDGGVYMPSKGVLGLDPLTIIKGPPQALKTAPPSMQSASDQVMEGGRHDHLKKKAVKFGHTSKTEDELLAYLMDERDVWCDAGNHPVRDSEVVEIAKWAWSKLLSADLWGGEKMLAMKAKTVETLTSNPDGGIEAFALYSILKNAHPFPDTRFALNFDGMKEARLVTFGEGKFHKAKKLLQQEGFIELMANYSVGNRSNQYRLTRR
jgi:hypothetical protein